MPETKSRYNKKYNKKYYEDNKEKCIEKVMERYHKKREQCVKYGIERYKQKRGELLKKANTKFTCECGGRYSYSTKPRHTRTKKHKKYLESIALSTGVKIVDEIDNME